MLLNCGVGEDSWESLGLKGDQTCQSQRKSVLNFHWKDWCWSWSSNTLATWCKELTHWKRPRCWERLKAEGEGDDRGWDGWMASPTQCTWVWASSGSWCWTGKPGILQSMGSQRVRHDWATELNWRKEKSQFSNLNSHVKKLGKEEQNKPKAKREKKLIKKRMNKTENRNNLKNQFKKLLLEKINKIDKPLARLTKKKRRHKFPVSEMNEV